MKITILTLGSRGHIQPFIALGLSLQHIGHTVCLATSLDFKNFVEQFGLECFPIAETSPEVICNRDAKKLAGTNASLVQFLLYYYQRRRSFSDYLSPCLKLSWQACQSTEVIISNTLTFWGYDISQKLNIPFYIAPPAPTGPTRKFPHPYLSSNLTLGSFLNYQTHILSRNFYWQFFREAVNAWRQQTLGLPPWRSNENPFAHMRSQKVPFLYQFSSHILPKPTDWSEESVITGYWHLQVPISYSPPPELTEFLEAGASPICFSFGSMVDPNPQELINTIFATLESTQQRGIILSEQSGINELGKTNSVYVTRSIPHSWLLSKVSAFVHHGGLGTTAASIQAGIPSIIIPYFNDHHFWGKRLAQLGVGPKPIPRKKMTVQRLSEAIREATTNSEMKTRLACLAKKLQQENGVKNAIAAMTLDHVVC
jgi:sterol 3beta-glucosyltransferase